nr:hypothetical protein [Entomobacter blattae]
MKGEGWVILFLMLMAHADGAVDNPELICTCVIGYECYWEPVLSGAYIIGVIGDGDAETRPLATAWHI